MSRRADSDRREAHKRLARVAKREKRLAEIKADIERENDQDRLIAKALFAAADAVDGVVAEESDPDQTP